MKKFTLAAVAALALSAVPAFGADMPVKAKPVAAAPPSAWDFAFGAAVMSDYNFRGISQSNRRPSVTAYFEPRYNINENFQLYAGVGGYSIAFPNNAAPRSTSTAASARPSASSLSISAFGTTTTRAAGPLTALILPARRRRSAAPTFRPWPGSWPDSATSSRPT